MSRPLLTVAICDPLPVVIAGIRAELSREPAIKIVGQANDCQRAVELIRRLRPRVIIADRDLPPRGSGDLTRRLARFPVGTSPKVIIMEQGPDGAESIATIGSVDAVVSKREITDCLVPLIQLVAFNDVVVLPTSVARSIHVHAGAPTDVPPSARVSRLTAREREVLMLVARANDSRRIAASLGVSEATVRSHLHSLLHKLDLRDRAHAVDFAYEEGLVRAVARRRDRPDDVS